MLKSLSSRPASTAAAAAAATAVGAYATSKAVAAESPALATATASATVPPTFRKGPNLVSLRLHSIEAVSPDTKRLRFELPDPAARSGLGLVSALLTITRPDGRWLPVARPYTPVGDLNQPGYLDFLIKHYPNGTASSHLHSLTPGQSVSFAGPLPGFSWTPNQHAHVALVAGGAGITPMYQLAHGILANPADRTRITLVWGVNTDADLFLASEFETLRRQHPDRLTLVYTVSKPAPGSPHPVGRITKELLEKAIPASENKQGTKVFVCGPPAMEAALAGGRGFGKAGGVLAELGYASSQVYKF